eukprot:COSAG06_NODE_21747_length_746_cov_36.234930_1_plen_71_part_00
MFAGAGTVAYPAFDEIAPGMTPDGWADEGWYRLIQGGQNYLLVQKRHFLSRLYKKTIILPRQAQDKHGES